VSDSCFKFMLGFFFNLNYLNYNHRVNWYVITSIFFDVPLVVLNMLFFFWLLAPGLIN
jgi:hypothetical protein